MSKKRDLKAVAPYLSFDMNVFHMAQINWRGEKAAFYANGMVWDFVSGPNSRSGYYVRAEENEDVSQVVNRTTVNRLAGNGELILFSFMPGELDSFGAVPAHVCLSRNGDVEVLKGSSMMKMVNYALGHALYRKCLSFLKTDMAESQFWACCVARFKKATLREIVDGARKYPEYFFYVKTEKTPETKKKKATEKVKKPEPASVAPARKASKDTWPEFPANSFDSAHDGWLICRGDDYFVARKQGSEPGSPMKLFRLAEDGLEEPWPFTREEAKKIMDNKSRVLFILKNKTTGVKRYVVTKHDSLMERHVLEEYYIYAKSVGAKFFQNLRRTAFIHPNAAKFWAKCLDKLKGKSLSTINYYVVEHPSEFRDKLYVIDPGDILISQDELSVKLARDKSGAHYLKFRSVALTRKVGDDLLVNYCRENLMDIIRMFFDKVKADIKEDVMFFPAEEWVVTRFDIHGGGVAILDLESPDLTREQFDFIHAHCRINDAGMIRPRQSQEEVSA